MLFNSYEFILLFLPVTLFGFYLIGGRGHHRVAIAWLVAASLIFYGWWNPAYLGLILLSILLNYAVGITLNTETHKFKRHILIFGITINLALLGYFKYANFFIDNINAVTGSNIVLHQIILPLAISFFTFQQIAYLVDTSRGETREYSFLHYCLFVTFFPQLLAGPIVHHKEMLPQFSRDKTYNLQLQNIAIGFTIFSIGLFKKVVFADGLSEYSVPIFAAAEQGISLTFFEAWGGSLAWTLQYYFDFSGYSDMAIGLGRMFGVRLPLNFNSPYKATSMIDYWRRWHITLSRFLRDYLYIPLGGNRKGAFRQRINLMITMLLGGLWHGASWTFLIWGGLNGILLIINAQYRKYHSKKATRGFFSNIIIGWFLTFTCAVFVRVLFCSTSLDGAGNILAGMTGLHGISIDSLPNNQILSDSKTSSLWNTILLLLLVSIALPNTQQIMRRYRPAFVTYKGEISRFYKHWLEWRPSKIWAIFIFLIFTTALLRLSSLNKFLYFQF